MSLDPELDSFKRLDLREYAASRGYALDRKESWRGSAVMRNAAGDKIVIKLGPDGHYVYFSVRDDRDNGSIIDFVMNRSQVNFGKIRLELRAWSGRRPSSALPAFPRMEVTAKDREKVERAWHRMLTVDRHPYLEEVRMIPAALLSSPRFIGRVRIDSHGNAVFPHFDAGGLSGFEMKNRSFTGFAAGGEKGLWTSRSHNGDRRLVFAESAIDALSYAALFPDEAARYASVGGKMNPQQPGLVRSEIAKLPNGGEVISAMDNDAEGAKLAALIEACVQDSDREDLIYRGHFPVPPAKDWNDVLRSSKHHSFPAVRF